VYKQWCSWAGTRGSAVPALLPQAERIHHYFQCLHNLHLVLVSDIFVNWNRNWNENYEISFYQNWN